jgi:methanogenic corrinoid protein MtbC1
VGEPAAARGPVDVSGLLKLVAGFEAEPLRQALVADWARLGPVEFLETRVGPLVREVGEAWARGELEVRHEHFLAERVSDLLGALRMPFEERARGPLVVYATLPGELHGLGLQMAALVLAAAGCRSLYLGTDVPIRQLAALARDLQARAVALSVSRASRGPASANALRRLRELLPRRVLIVAGVRGAGCPPLKLGPGPSRCLADSRPALSSPPPPPPLLPSALLAHLTPFTHFQRKIYLKYGTPPERSP